MLLYCFFTLLVIFAEKGSPASHNCRPFWKSYNGSCYYFGTKKATWPEAEAYCWSMNARLVEIETEAESNYLEYQLRAIYQHDHDHEAAYWLGGNDIEMEGLFNWVKSGKYVTYTDWTPGQPDNANDEDCMELRGVFYYHWNDFQCNVPQRFICEAP
ncbi:perlucin-like protein isoform X2 [Crassostrea virginica]|nr:perlucin-like protein isoform X2 [Crassostrea virginica]